MINNKRKAPVKFCTHLKCPDTNCKHHTPIKRRQMIEFKTCIKFKEEK